MKPKRPEMVGLSETPLCAWNNAAVARSCRHGLLVLCRFGVIAATGARWPLVPASLPWTRRACRYRYGMAVTSKTRRNLLVHLVGGFEDTHLTQNDDISNGKHSGHSFPLWSKLLQALKNRRERFHIQTLFVLGHNTGIDSDGYSYPIIHGLVKPADRTISPANFDRTSRCPNEIVKRI
ncbi:hypothetical protein IFM89_039391 [Coptis chinensis]|uniref:Uncharacterized protein n=1 Tax=Coptis chinensis TaxID=261450 RepID=A0A835I4E7_9MAGN|nr:hypothetical protein IFM89_039391 [Coptis chinensis]